MSLRVTACTFRDPLSAIRHQDRRLRGKTDSRFWRIADRGSRSPFPHPGHSPRNLILPLVPWYWFLPIALLVLGLAGGGIHLLVRRLGDEGLVDYIPQSPSKKAVGSAMINLGVIYDPSLEHVIEFEQSGGLVAQGSGEPLIPGPDGAPEEPEQEPTPGLHS